MTSLQYHMLELQIQQDPSDPRYLLPPVPEQARLILDVGCGMGQTLLTMRPGADAVACGIDVDEEALAYGLRTAPHLLLARASAERLPFASNSFDYVYSRVALPWMHIPSALAEIARVTRPGGGLWCALVRRSDAVAELRHAAANRSLKNLVYRLYVLANGAVFNFSGRQFRYPLDRTRCESFQTVRAMTRSMHAVGLRSVRVEPGKFFVMTADKPL